MARSDAQERLAARVRAELAGRDFREVPMLGGLSFMVDEALAVAADGDGGLLVRVDPARREDLVGRPGARPAAMRNGREMGDRWLQVTPDGVRETDDLRFWIAVGLDARPL